MTRFIEQLKKKNIRIVNPMWSSSELRHVSGWMLEASGHETLEESITICKKIIAENDFDWKVVKRTDTEGTFQFFVYY